MTQEYNNTLDSWYQSCPNPVQQVLHKPYTTVSGWLRWVTGDPNKVAGEGPTYEYIGREIARLSAEVETTTNSMPGWEGQANVAFRGKMQQVKANLDKLGPAVVQTREILKAAAETSVEAANMILSIIRSVIEFLLSSLAIAAALAVFTFGASAAAWVAANLAKGAHALAKVMQGLTRVAKVLKQIATLLEKIATIMKKIAEILKTIRALLKALKELKKGADLTTKAIIMGAEALIKLPINAAGNAALGGVSNATGIPGLSMPGGVGEVINAGQDGAGAVGASNRAVDAANASSPR